MTPEEIHNQIYAMGELARKAALKLAILTAEQKNTILCAMADSLRNNASEIVQENAKDILAGEQKGLSSALLDLMKVV